MWGGKEEWEKRLFRFQKEGMRAVRDKRTWEQLGQGSRDNNQVVREMEGRGGKQRGNLLSRASNPTLPP